MRALRPKAPVPRAPLVRGRPKEYSPDQPLPPLKAIWLAARHNPVLRPLYQRLRAAGKAPKLARVALMRKLIELAYRLLRDPAFSPVA